jgi:FKBP-type peptidyl-prolyl cis-trans isomerase SlyD
VKIERDRVVSIEYTIRLADGTVVESSTGDGGEPLTYMHGRAQIVPGVEQAIEGAETGAEVEVVVPPDGGFGTRDPDGVFLVPRAAFPADEAIDAGVTYSATRPDGRAVLFRVLETRRDTVLVDTNHPLAGETLHVWIAVRHVRDATDEEKLRGAPIARMAQSPPPS